MKVGDKFADDRRQYRNGQKLADDLLFGIFNCELQQFIC